MPNQITHYYHGQEVLKNLEGKAREAIYKYPHAFRIGSVGPDIMFVLRESTKKKEKHYANAMQYLKMYEVFAASVKYLKENPDECQLSYILGLLCHYVMDMRGHAYVNFFVEEIMPKYFPPKMQSALHPMIEAGLDEYILKDYMKVDPRTYSIGKDFKPGGYEKKKIGDIYENVINGVFGFDVKSKTIKRIINITIMFFYLTTDKSGVKKKIFNRLEDRKGSKKQMSSSIRPPYLLDEYDYMNRNKIKWRKVRNRDVYTEESFDEVLNDSINLGVKYINDFMAALSGEVNLKKQDFKVNYEGVSI